VRRAEVFREKQGIEVLTGHRAEAIDRRRKVVTGAAEGGQPFERPYDRLLIATGARAVVPDLPGSGLPGVLPLKNLEDGRRIKQLLAAGGVRRAVILGMGYIALEMCETLRGLGVAVDMVKPNPVFMPWLDTELAAAVAAELDTRQVGVHAGRAPQRIAAANGTLSVRGEGFEFACELLLLAVGVRPNSELARDAGLELGVSGAIAVDRGLRTSDPDIFAAGDCADAFHVVTGAKTWVPLALRANRAGWAVADAVCGQSAELDGVAGTAAFKVFDLEVARTGLSAAEAQAAGFDPSAATIKSSTRAHGYPGAAPLWVSAVGDRGTGRLLGMQIVGSDGAAHRINAPAVALHAGLTVAQFAQTDLAYAPPFGPSWDPMLTCASQLLKKMA
jgi:NADPH-dependent 2,4-dienoyl-CoA reductase/sulfur reductase-like enzyme